MLVRVRCGVLRSDHQMTLTAMQHEIPEPPTGPSSRPSGEDRQDLPEARALRDDAQAELACRTTLSDGTEVTIRPIRELDCSSLGAMLSECSEESLYSRYERLVTEPPDRIAEELCRPDLRLERTMVGEIDQGTSSKIIGIAQLIADPSFSAAEYAVLVVDRWQSKGLGGAFTDVCVRLTRQWGVRRIVAEFLPSNTRMIRILEKRRFDLSRDLREHVVSGEKLVGPHNEAPAEEHIGRRTQPQ